MPKAVAASPALFQQAPQQVHGPLPPPTAGADGGVVAHNTAAQTSLLKPTTWQLGLRM